MQGEAVGQPSGAQRQAGPQRVQHWLPPALQKLQGAWSGGGNRGRKERRTTLRGEAGTRERGRGKARAKMIGAHWEEGGPGGKKPLEGRR